MTEPATIPYEQFAAAKLRVGKKAVGCLNLGEKNIGGFMSNFLCTGFPDEKGEVVLIIADKKVPNGGKLF